MAPMAPPVRPAQPVHRAGPAQSTAPAVPAKAVPFTTVVRRPWALRQRRTSSAATRPAAVPVAPGGLGATAAPGRAAGTAAPLAAAARAAATARRAGTAVPAR